MPNILHSLHNNGSTDSVALVGICSRYNADISHGEDPQMVMGEHSHAMEARRQGW